MDEINQPERIDAEIGVDLSGTLKEVRQGLEQTKEFIQRLDRMRAGVLSAEKMLTGRRLILMDQEAKSEVKRMVAAIEDALGRLSDTAPSSPDKHSDSGEIASFLEKVTGRLASADRNRESLADLEADFKQNHATLTTLAELSRSRDEADAEIRANLQHFQENLEEDKDERILLQEAMDLIALTAEHFRVNAEKTRQINETLETVLAWTAKISDRLIGEASEPEQAPLVLELLSLLKELQLGTYNLIELFNIRSMRDDALGFADQGFDPNLY